MPAKQSESSYDVRGPDGRDVRADDDDRASHRTIENMLQALSQVDALLGKACGRLWTRSTFLPCAGGPGRVSFATVNREPHAATGPPDSRANRVASAMPTSRASLVLTRPAMGAFAITTSCKRKGAAIVRGALAGITLRRRLGTSALMIRPSPPPARTHSLCRPS